MTPPKLKHLFEPIKIGRMVVQNRIVMPAMDPGFGIDEQGRATPQLTEYFAERARSGPGMMLTGASAVHPLGAPHPNVTRELSLWDDSVLPSLTEMVKQVHKGDTKFGAQLVHQGLASLPGPTMSPSVVPELVAAGFANREMSSEDIRECVKAFGQAALRCVKAGFDFVEIHAGHSYLINEFMTPRYNRRTDKYGGSFANRIRFLLEIVREVRKKIKDTPIGVKINGDDFLGEDGWTLPDACRLAPILEREGVSYITVTGGGSIYGTLYMTIAPMYEKEGLLVPLAEEVKKQVSIPVVAVGRIRNPITADMIVREGRADLVAMGRAHLADAALVEKARRGDLEDIRPCIGECLGCIEGIFRRGEASCAVNPRVGREYALKDIQGAKSPIAKRVLVAGAGLAGLEAARSAAFAGHKVVLCDRRGCIGGQMTLAAKIPGRQEIADIVPWYERQLNKLRVETRLNTEVNEDMLGEICPEVLVVATGSLPEVPLGYIDELASIKDIELLMVDDVLEGNVPSGRNILVIGGDQIGLQVADYLSEVDRTVHIVHKGTQPGTKMASHDRLYLVRRLEGKGVKTYLGVHKVEIKSTDQVWVVSDSGREKLPHIDTIVLASDRRPTLLLEEVAKRRGIETYVVGDACGVTGDERGMIMAAIATGYEVGRQI